MALLWLGAHLVVAATQGLSSPNCGKCVPWWQRTALLRPCAAWLHQSGARWEVFIEVLKRVCVCTLLVTCRSENVEMLLTCRAARPITPNLVQRSWDVIGKASKDALICTCIDSNRLILEPDFLHLACLVIFQSDSIKLTS